jgi:hypothetical protein
MDREAYRNASFLDDRLFQAPQDAHVLPLVQAISGLSERPRHAARWIFHIGHVGSTLVARLLGELPGVLSVREPRILRDLVAMPQAERAASVVAAVRLLSRTFAPDEIALVKATSFVSEIAPELVPAGGRALFLFAQPHAYICGILAGENSIRELHALADSRKARMIGRVGAIPGGSDAHLAAAAWACEMTALEAAAAVMGDRLVRWDDFDRMLSDMRTALRELVDFLGFEAEGHALEAIAAGPLMWRYSKATEYEYSPALRRELLEAAAQEHAADIADALMGLGEMAEDWPLLKSALNRAAGKD